MRLVRTITLALALGVYAAPASAAPILIDFESLADLEELTTQFAGLTFSGAIGLQSGALGGNLNEFDFPPLSGDFVAANLDSSGIRVDFATGADSVGGYFTYNAPVTMTAYSGAIELGSVTSQFIENYVSSGNLANEQLQLAFAGPISHVTFVGFGGGLFTLDDFSANTIDDVGPAPVPEPGTIGLLLGGIALLAGRRKVRKLTARQS